MFTAVSCCQAATAPHESRAAAEERIAMEIALSESKLEVLDSACIPIR
jgi:hypothetical protein